MYIVSLIPRCFVLPCNNSLPMLQLSMGTTSPYPEYALYEDVNRRTIEIRQRSRILRPTTV